MALEIEAKIQVSSHEAVRAALVAANAEHRGICLETNHILDHALLRLRSLGCGLRVRAARSTADDSVTATATFKGQRRGGKLKQRQEIEIGVSDADRALALFDHLGFKPALVFEKMRETWTLDGCSIELDTVPELGTYVEVEGPDEATIADVLQRIGLDPADHVSNGYVAMLLKLSRKRAMTPEFRLPTTH